MAYCCHYTMLSLAYLVIICRLNGGKRVTYDGKDHFDHLKRGAYYIENRKIQPSRPWEYHSSSDNTQTMAGMWNSNRVGMNNGKIIHHQPTGVGNEEEHKSQNEQSGSKLLSNFKELGSPSYKVKLEVKVLVKDEEDITKHVIRIISNIFGDAETSYVVPLSSEFGKDTLTFKWTNKTMDFLPCSKDIISMISERLFSKNDGAISSVVKQAFLPYFRVMRIEEERSGNCSHESELKLEMRLLEKILSSNNTIRRRYRRSTMDGTAPQVNTTFGPFNATYCNIFFVQIPAYTFLDKEDGDTRNLTLSLHSNNETLVSSDSWLQLDRGLQTLYGYLKVSDSLLAGPEKLIKYKLRATDSSGLKTDITFNVKIPEKIPIVYFQIDLVVNSFEDTGKPDVNEAVFLAYKIFSYFEDISFSNINILRFDKNHSKDHTRDSITFGWTNCTVGGDTCPDALIDSLIRKVILPDGTPDPGFSSKLQPQYNIHKLSAKKVGICRNNTSSMSPRPSATPVHTLSPIIMHEIPNLGASTVTYFSYQIPNNTFYDFVDGYTRSLRLELRTSGNVSLATSSWLQFDSISQTMYGILTSSLFSQSYVKNFNYNLVAINSRGYSSKMHLSIKGSRQAVSFGAMFYLSGRDNSPASTYDVTILSATLQKLRSYVNDKSSNTIEVSSFERKLIGQQKTFSLAYANTTITRNDCIGLTSLVPLLKREGSLINEDLTVALVPDVLADRIDITRYGNCSNELNRTVLPSPTPGGLFPTVQNKLPVFSIKTGILFQYKIPANSFYDATDGDTTKLALRVTDINGNILSRNSWVQFENVKQVLYGVLPSYQQAVRPLQNFTFLLQARNSLGYTATQVFTIQSEFVHLDIGVIVTFNGRDYSSNQWNSVQLQSSMLTQLRDFLSVTSNDTIQMLSFRHQSTGSSQFTALWTDSRLTSTACDQALIRHLEEKIFAGKDTVHPNLISKMLPNIVLIEANMTYYGQCLSYQSLNSPNYTHALPVINATAGLLLTYLIPRNTFVDNIDGDTRHLQLTLASNDGSKLNIASRVQFNSSMQTLVGLFFDDVLAGSSSSKLFFFILTARNSRKFTTSVTLSIRVEMNPNTFGIVVRTEVNTFHSQYSSALQADVDFIRGLSNYVKPSMATDFSIISSTRTSTNIQQSTITWSYNRIDGKNCNKTELNQFLKSLRNADGNLNQNFVQAMSPRFLLFSVATRAVRDCNNSFSSITALPHSITPSPSIPLKTSDISSIIHNNSSPQVTSKILPLFAYFCIPFSYRIPNDLFYDKEQGNTRNLQIHLETRDRQRVGMDSWLQYSKTSQVLYGILKIDDFYRKPPGGYRYYVIATDNQGQQAVTDFTIAIPESPVKYNHVVTMKLNRVFDASVPDVNEQLLIITKILEYFGDASSNSINLISYDKSNVDNAAIAKWSNCSIQYNPCPTNELNKILRKMTDNASGATDSFRNAMLPQYKIKSLTVEKHSPCNTSDHSSIVTASASIFPSPSIPPSTPPILLNPIGQLNITWCAPFQYEIPANVFYDARDGSTRNLSLQLFHRNGSQLLFNYWLRFEENAQTIYAYPLLRDLDQNTMTQFLIVATNGRNQNVSQIITAVTTTPKPSPNHQLEVTASAYVTNQISDVEMRILIYNKMKGYFKSNRSEVMSFASYAKSGQSPSSLLFAFSDCSLTENACDKSEIDSMLGKIFTSPGIVSSDFIIAFGPEIVITSTRVKNLGLCSSAVSTQASAPSSAREVLSSTAANVPINRKPLVLQSISIPSADACVVFSFTVPERSFYDIEDGLTRSLKLSVTTMNGTALPNNSWLTFNADTQSFKGVIVNEDVNSIQYLLIATDKGGLSASQKLTFRMKERTESLEFVVKTILTNYLPTSASRTAILEYVINKIGAYLSYGESMLVRIVSYELVPSSSNQLNITWTLCNLRDSCNDTFLKEIYNKLLIREGIVNPNFAIALGPSITINSVMIQQLNSCFTSNVPASSSFVKPTDISATYASSTQAYSSAIMPNSAPIFTRNISTLSVSLCSPFSMKLPSNLCTDREDGTSGTTIELGYKNGSSLDSASLLQHDRVNNTIYGIVKESDVLPNGQLKEKFAVRCVDTKGLGTGRDLEINVTGPFAGQSQYLLTFQTYLYPVSKLPNVDIQLLWIKKLSAYLQFPDSHNVLFSQFKRLSSIQAEFSFRLCSLDACNYTALQHVRGKLFSTIPNLNPQLITAMIPEFSIVSSNLHAPSVNVCPTVSTKHLSTLSQASSITPARNTPVKVLRNLTVINATLCSKFEYVIPYDTFFDLEDGFTSNLTVTLNHDNNSAVGPDSWIQYYKSSLSITGYMMQELTTRTDTFNYKLIARDSGGSLASLPVTLKSTSLHKGTNHSFTTEADVHGTFTDNVAIMTEVVERIKRYFGASFNKGVFFVNFTKYAYEQPKILFTWGSCELLESCDLTSWKTVSDRLLFSGTIINFEFISALAPNILVRKLTQSVYPNCSTVARTTSLTSSSLMYAASTVEMTAYTSAMSSEMISPSTAYSIEMASTIPSSPTVRVALSPVIATICSLLTFRIPENAFFDATDGSTRNLILSARLQSEQSLPSNFWFSFDAASQTINGQATVDALRDQPSGGYMVIIRATNRRRGYVETTLRVLIDQSIPNINHNITLSLEEDGVPFLNGSDAISFIRNKTSDYFGDTTRKNFGVISYNRQGSVTNITWYNCSMGSQRCNVQKLEAYFSQMVNQMGIINTNFLSVYLPRLRINQVITSSSGSCYQSTSLLQTLPDTITTVPSRSQASFIRRSASVPASSGMHAVNTPLLSSVIRIDNSPPVALKEVNISQQYCKGLRFKVPNGTFYDKEDGEELKLTLLTLKGRPIDCNSTLRLNETSNELYGELVLSAITYPVRYILTATDKGALSVATPLTLSSQTLPNFATFIVTFNVKLSSSKCISDALTAVRDALLRHLSFANIGIISYLADEKNDNLKITWTDCSFFDTSCNSTRMAYVEERVLRNNTASSELYSSLLPKVDLQSTAVFSTKICSRRQLQMNVTLCTKLNYTLTDGSFNSTVFDVPTGKENRLLYTITNKNGIALPWVSFDRETSSITVLPVYTELKNRSLTQLTLNANYNGSVLKSLDVALHHSSFHKIWLNYSISIRTISYRQIAEGDMSLLDSIVKRLSTFENDWLIVQYNRTRTYPETVHVSLTPCFTHSFCNSTRAESLTRDLSLGNGIPSYRVVREMWPDFELLELNVTSKGVCQTRRPIDNVTSYINVTVALCTKLYMPVKDNLITKNLKKEGNLTYELLNAAKFSVKLQSWVQFDTFNRIIYGIPTQKNLIDQPANGYIYYIRVSDADGGILHVQVNITVIGNTKKPEYSQEVFYTSPTQDTESVADILIELRSKLGRVLGNASGDSIGFIAFERNYDFSRISKVEFTNCSLLKSPGTCPNRTVNLLSTALLSSNGQPSNELVTALGSNYKVVNMIETRSDACGNDSNTPPKVNVPIPSLNASTCARLEYSIPNDTFVDKEDGGVSYMFLSLKTSAGFTLPPTSWIQLDLISKTIYGIPTYDVVLSRQLDGYSFLLQAKDSQGSTALLPVQVNIPENVTERSLVNVLVNTSFPDWTIRVEIQRTFLQKTEKCLNLPKRSIGMAYYRQDQIRKQEINMSVFYNCSTSRDLCDENELRGFLRLFVSNLTVKASYKACMYPDFNIIHINSSISKSCKNETRNNPPVVKRSMPQLNFTFCEIFYFKIPNDTFYDSEDGAKILDSAELVKLNGEPLRATEYVQYNKRTRTIYALNPSTATSNQTSYEYNLRVRDDGGNTAETKVVLKTMQMPRNFTYKVCLSLRMYTSTMQKDIDIVIYLLKRVENFLTNGSMHEPLTAIDYSVSGSYPRKVNLCFSNCSFVDGACQKKSVDLIKEKIVVGDSFATLKFKQHLNPDFTVIKVTDYYVDYCRVIPSPTTMVPTSSISLASTIMPTLVHRCLDGSNSAPKIINSVGTLVVYVGKPTSYDIKSDIVYDQEDGYLRILRLTEMDGKEISSTWIYYDEVNQRIYASVLNGRDQGEKSFRVVATDSCGASVYDVLKINVVGQVSCCYTIRLQSYMNFSNFGTSIKMQYSLYKKLTQVYNDTSEYIRLYSIANETSNNYTGISYTNSSFTNESCHYYQTGYLSKVAFQENGSRRVEFIEKFAAYQVFDAVVNNNSLCNESLIIVPPVIIPPPGAAAALTFNDWLWYILPFIILAFLAICCCFLFYWCTACRETCCGKKKDSDLFTAAAAQPIQREVVPMVAADYRAENPDVEAQAAAVAARPLEEAPYPEELYADIATTKDSSVPSLHRNNKQLPLWMTKAEQDSGPQGNGAAVAPITAVEEPSIQGVAAMPQEAAPDRTDAPVSSGVAAQPRNPVSEPPFEESYVSDNQRRPSYLVTPSTSVYSFEEEPVTQSTAPAAQAGQPLFDRIRVNEEQINPVDRQNAEAAPQPILNTGPLAAPVNEYPSESVHMPTMQAPVSGTGPLLRLPSTPHFPPGDAPPPYSPPRRRQMVPKPQTVTINTQAKRTIFAPRRSPQVSVPLHRRSLVAVERHERSPLSRPRFRNLPRATDADVRYDESKERRVRHGPIRRTFRRPSRRRLDPVYSLHNNYEPLVIERSPKSVKRHRNTSGVIRKSPDLSSYFTESDADEAWEEEYREPQMPSYGSKEFINESFDGSHLSGEMQVPVEINGVVNAPEKVLMSWMRDGSLKTTITNASPNLERQIRQKDQKRFKVKSPQPIRKYKKVRQKRTPQQHHRPSMRNSSQKSAVLMKSPSDAGRIVKQGHTADFNAQGRDVAFSEDALSQSKASERTLKRGYPYSGDIYDYVETARRSRPTTDKPQEKIDRGLSPTRSLEIRSGQRASHRRSDRTLGRSKSRRSMGEILARMSRRRDLKRNREAFENDLFYDL